MRRKRSDDETTISTEELSHRCFVQAERFSDYRDIEKHLLERQAVQLTPAADLPHNMERSLVEEWHSCDDKVMVGDGWRMEFEVNQRGIITGDGDVELSAAFLGWTSDVLHQTKCLPFYCSKLHHRGHRQVLEMEV